jgi:signal transduction histidine kinase
MAWAVWWTTSGCGRGPIGPALSPVDLQALSTDAVRQDERVAAEKGGSMIAEVAEGTVVHTDRELLMLVFQNLVGNAVKYSRKGTVRARSGQRREGGMTRCALLVSDEGPGIAHPDRDRIFAAFARGEVFGESGVGLGLAIAG